MQGLKSFMHELGYSITLCHGPEYSRWPKERRKSIDGTEREAHNVFDFDYIKYMFEQNKIMTSNTNIMDPMVLDQLQKGIDSKKLETNTLYLSNVEDWNIPVKYSKETYIAKLRGY
jgi:ribosome-interacting GTPase 1